VTAVVGVEHAGGVVMGADSISVDPGYYRTRDRTTRKLFRRGAYLIGYTSSFRVGDLLRFQVPWPAPRPGVGVDALYEHLVVKVIPGIRETLKNGGALTTKDGSDAAGGFLLAVSGRLFRVDIDLHVGRYEHGFATCGAGEDVANGALHATVGMSPKTRVQRALAAAEACCIRVRGPFHLATQPRS